MGKLMQAIEALDLRPLARELPAAAVAPLLADLKASPRDRLARLLDTWSGMEESAWTEASVAALYGDIMDVFAAHPAEADGWYRAWRQEHPGARLAPVSKIPS